MPPVGRAAHALRTIGEVVAETGVAAHILRYWERQVPALQPLRRAGDRRYYRVEDVLLIGELARLINDEGYTLDGAARAVTGRRKTAGAGAIAPAPSAAVMATVAATGTAAAHEPQASLFAARPGASAPDGAISLSKIRAVRNRLRSALDEADG